MTTRSLIHKRGFSYLLLAIAVIGLASVLYPVRNVIVLAILTTYLILPVYHWLKHRDIPTRICILITRIVILGVIILPLAILLPIVVHQSSELVAHLSSNIDTSQIDTYGFIQMINSWLEYIPIVEWRLDLATLQETGAKIATRVSEKAASSISSIGNSVINLITSIILYIFTVSGLLTGHHRLLNYLQKLLPIDKKTFEDYKKHLGGMSSSMVKATLVIAVLGAIVTSLSLWIAGVSYVGLWGVIAVLLGMIPMIGSAFVAIPIALVWILMGNTWRGIFIILVNQLITNNIDNVLRPKLVKSDIKINETLTLLSTFGGLALFGILGVIYGPVIMSFALVTFDMFHPNTSPDEK